MTPYPWKWSFIRCVGTFGLLCRGSVYCGHMMNNGFTLGRPVSTEDDSQPEIIVVQNWFEEFDGK